MAARLLTRKRRDMSRAAIQTTQARKASELIFALSQVDPSCPHKTVEMTDGQIRAALGLLRKTIPDLAVTAHTGGDGGPVVIQIVTGVRAAWRTRGTRVECSQRT